LGKIRKKDLIKRNALTFTVGLYHTAGGRDNIKITVVLLCLKKKKTTIVKLIADA